MLAEVLREREAQLKIKEAKDERAKHLNDKYLQLQEKVIFLLPRIRFTF